MCVFDIAVPINSLFSLCVTELAVFRRPHDEALSSTPTLIYTLETLMSMHSFICGLK